MRDPAVAVSLLILVVIAGAGATVHQPRAVVEPPGDSPWVDVMTYNLHQYWSNTQTGKHSIEAIRAVIAAADPDIIGLQETEGGRVTSGSFDGVRWLSHTLGYHSAPGPPARDGLYGIALLSKWPIVTTEWQYLPNQDGVERGVLISTIDHPDGVINVAVTQFDTRLHPEERIRQAHGLLRILDKRGPLLMMGDFNAPASSDDEPYVILSSGFADAWMVAGLPEEGADTDLAHGTGSGRVDLIWLRGEWLVNACAVRGHADASDHRAVICTVQPRPT